MIKEEKDIIWLYILRNIYASIRMKKEKFDIVIGNSPWIAFRYMQNKEYQEKIKELIFIYNLLDRDKIHLYTQMEFASLFLRRCADLYLREGGIIAFVMPRSVLTSARQHEKFKVFSRTCNHQRSQLICGGSLNTSSRMTSRWIFCYVFNYTDVSSYERNTNNQKVS